MRREEMSREGGADRGAAGPENPVVLNKPPHFRQIGLRRYRRICAQVEEGLEPELEPVRAGDRYVEHWHEPRPI